MAKEIVISLFLKIIDLKLPKFPKDCRKLEFMFTSVWNSRYFVFQNSSFRRLKKLKFLFSWSQGPNLYLTKKNVLK